MDKLLIDRSRIQTYLECSRKYFWAYEYAGQGLAPAKRPIPLAIGGSIHKGLEALLRGIGIEEAVQQGVDELRSQLRAGGLGLGPDEDVLYVYKEQECLVEALLRVWAKKRVGSFLEEYEVVEIEQEYDLPLSDRVTFMSRADGLLRNRQNGGLYVLSFKTAKRYESRLSSDGGHDVQGLSEVAAIEPLLGEEILGIQMEYLVKGARLEYPKGSGKYSQSNFLVHPWKNQKGDYAWRYKWADETGGHTLGKGWYKCNVWEDMSIAEWVERLDSGDVQGSLGIPLNEVCISPVPYYRRRTEIEDWQAQIRGIGERLYNLRGSVLGIPTREALNEHYPQNRRACDWPTACPMQAICFGPGGAEPEETGLYIKRTPHHDTEVERFSEDEFDNI